MSGMQTSPDPLSQASVDACALRCGCIPLPPCLSRVNTPVTICVTRSVYLVCISWHGPGAGSIWSWTRAACLCTTLTPVPAPKPLLTLTYAGVGAEVLGVISLELHPHPIPPTSAPTTTRLLCHWVSDVFSPITPKSIQTSTTTTVWHLPLPCLFSSSSKFRKKKFLFEITRSFKDRGK